MASNIVLPLIDIIDQNIFSFEKSVINKNFSSFSSFQDKLNQIDKENKTADKLIAASNNPDETNQISVKGDEKLKNDIVSLIKNLDYYQKRLSEIIKITASGKKFSAKELLSFQAEMHRIIYQIEMTSKLIEQFTNGLKTTLQTPV